MIVKNRLLTGMNLRMSRRMRAGSHLQRILTPTRTPMRPRAVLKMKLMRPKRLKRSLRKNPNRNRSLPHRRFLSASKLFRESSPRKKRFFSLTLQIYPESASRLHWHLRIFTITRETRRPNPAMSSLWEDSFPARHVLQTH